VFVGLPLPLNCLLWSYLQDDRHSVTNRATTLGELGSNHPPKEREDHHGQSNDDNVQRAWLNHFCSPPLRKLDVGTPRAHHAAGSSVDVQHLMSVQIGHNVAD
jgi:hypothetical protein